MAKRAKADAQDVKNRYATNKRHARGGMNDSKILLGIQTVQSRQGASMSSNKLTCPACGEKLPYDRDAKRDRNGEIIRFRECACGYCRTERVHIEITEFFPESTPIPQIPHPGEGGYGLVPKVDR